MLLLSLALWPYVRRSAIGVSGGVRGTSEDFMAGFSDNELAYLRDGRKLARIATVGADGTPHVTPVGWSVSAALDAIDVGGRNLERSKKYRDIRRSGRAAIVIDDLASTDPWRPRGIEVRGRAELVEDPAPMIRIHADRVVSWGLEG